MAQRHRGGAASDHRNEHGRQKENSPKFTKIFIRQAVSADAPVIAEMTVSNRAFHLTGDVLEPVQVQRLLEDEDTRMLVLETESGSRPAAVLCGSLAMTTVDLPDGRAVPTGKKAMILDLWLMDETLAGHALEAVMMDTLVEMCRTEQAVSIFGYYHPNEDNHPGEGIFRKLGFRKAADTGKYSAWKFVLPPSYMKKNRTVEVIKP